MTLSPGYLRRVVAGAIFGLYMAHLLYFLNPQVEVSPARLAFVTLVYGVICGLLFGSALWALRSLRVRIIGGEDDVSSSRGFGFVVLAAYVSAFIYWIHLDAVRIYLPIGAVRTLSKATNILTGTAFALLVLWLLGRNAGRKTSRAIFLSGVALIIVSSFFLYERRERYQNERQNVVVANVGTVAGQRPVIIVAIRNLPFDWTLTMAGEGGVGFFEQEQKRGYFTRLEPFPTTSPKALWASLATGKLPYRHGVTGRFSYRTPLHGANRAERFLLLPSGVGFRAWGLVPPVQRISAQLPAGDSLPLWSLYEQLGFRATVINWPAASSTRASRLVAERLVRSGPRPREVSAVAQRFNGAGGARERILDGLAADIRALDNLEASLGEGSEQVHVVALDGFSEAQKALHIYRNDLPLRSEMRGEALRAYVQQIDRRLGAMRASFPDHLMVVVSPSAPTPPPLPATAYFVARNALTSDDQGADDGFLLIAGAGVVHRDHARSAFVIDVVPTVLFAAGLPIGRDMDGRVITEAFDEAFLRTRPLSLIPTYEARQIMVRRVS